MGIVTEVGSKAAQHFKVGDPRGRRVLCQSLQGELLQAPNKARR